MKAPKKAKERAAQLREAITKYRTLQHEKDVSPLSPEALDSLKYELSELEERYPELVSPTSPTQVVAGAPLPFLKFSWLVPSAVEPRKPACTLFFISISSEVDVVT